MVDMANGVCLMLNISSKDNAYETRLKLIIDTIKHIRSDNDRLLVDNNIDRQIMLDNKIIAELIGRENHYRIGFAERRWQALYPMALSMLRHSCLGLEFMVFAIQAANRNLNRVWSSIKHCIPFTKLANIPTIDYLHLHDFGCSCYVQIDP